MFASRTPLRDRILPLSPVYVAAPRTFAGAFSAPVIRTLRGAVSNHWKPEVAGEQPVSAIDLAVPTIVEKKCSRCGVPFNCKQEAGCWCAAMHLDPAVLAELRTRFSDCLCEACLRKLAAREK